MINFVLCDDKKEILDKTSIIISKIMMPLEDEYKIHKFLGFDKKFENYIHNNDKNKVYILDIELPQTTGLEIAENIREVDWNSIIIILTAHSECQSEVFRARLMILDYISKYNNYETRLYETIKTSISIIVNSKTLIFKYCNTIYRIPYNEILYVKAANGRKCIIISDKGEEYEVNESLKALSKKLFPYFFQSHRSCIVNVTKVRKVDDYSKKITFKNGKEINLLSVRYGKDFGDYVRSYK